MRDIEKRLLNQIEQQRRDIIDLFNASVATVERPRPWQPSAAEVRLVALEQAVIARGKGVRDATLVATAKAFEDYLAGKQPT